ncbi:MAG: DNA repair protein RecO [Patescibacteria group bacterium]|nr:DNA repair protein RecO [Patescibacteria group bacterium]
MYFSLNSIILSRTAFREDDLLVKIYSQERGKLTLVARGAKKIKSKLAGHLEPISLSFLESARGKSLDQLIGAQIIKSYAGIKNDILKTAYANYFLELLDELTFENHADRRVFELTRKYLDFLDTAVYNDLVIGRITAVFKLLSFLGFNPAHKAELGFKNEINYVVSKGLSEIKRNIKIISVLSKLDKILKAELEEHLRQNLKSEEFLKNITNTGVKDG